MTGFHGAHVFGGVVGITVVLLRGCAGQFSAKHHIAVEAVSAYWHFVDIVWIAPVRDHVLPEVEARQMFVWRNALILGLIFVVVGRASTGACRAPAADDRPRRRDDARRARRMSMAFTFAILLRGSREL